MLFISRHFKLTQRKLDVDVKILETASFDNERGWILKPERLHQFWTKSCQATQKTIKSLSAKQFPTPRFVVSLLVLSSATHVVERPQPV